MPIFDLILPLVFFYPIYFQVSFNFKIILFVPKITQNIVTELRGPDVRSVVRSFGRSFVRSVGRSVVRSFSRPVRSLYRSILRSFLGSLVGSSLHLSVRPSKIATLTIGKGASFSYASNSSSSDSSSSSSSSDVESRLSLLWVFSLSDCNLLNTATYDFQSGEIRWHTECKLYRLQSTVPGLQPFTTKVTERGIRANSVSPRKEFSSIMKPPRNFQRALWALSDNSGHPVTQPYKSRPLFYKEILVQIS